MPIAYGIGGLISVPQGAVRGSGAPPSSFVGQLGQQYFDISTSPPTQYVYNGQTWESGGNAYATTTAPGLVELATAAEMAAGTSETLVPPVKEVFDYVNSVVIAGAPVATEVTAGIGQLATDAEAVAGTPSTALLALFVTPSNLASVFAAPPAVGGTTAGAGTFTDLTADGNGTVSLGANAASNFTVTGAFDLTLATTAGSLVVNAGEAVANAIDLNATAGGLDVDVALLASITSTRDNAQAILLEATAGGIDILASSASAGEDIDITATGSSVNISSSENVADAIVLSASAGGIDITAAGAPAEDIDITNTSGSIILTAGEAAANAISLQASAGGIDVDAVGSINIASSQNAADSIVITSSAGGIDILASGATAGEDIDIIATGSSVNIESTEDAALAIYLHANGGTSETIRLRSDLGTGVASIDILSDVGGITLTAGLGTADAINLNASNAAGGIDIDAGTGGIIADTTANISLDSATASNFTVTGASQDLTLAASGGSVGISASEAASDAIIIEASDAAGGLQLKAGTGGIAIGNEANTTPIGVGDAAPTASRTITIGGGTVVTAAVTDLIDIAPDGATTNPNSIKRVDINTGTVATGEVLTNIASGTVTSGTHTTAIATGNNAAGTMALNVMTGTGTKTLSIGNADGLTTTNFLGPVNLNTNQNNNIAINSGTSTGTITIGNTAAGAVVLNSGSTIAIGDASAGAVTVDTAAGISLDSATASNFTVTGAGADLTLSSAGGSIAITATEAIATAIVLTASDAAGGIDITTGGGSVDISSAGFVSVVADTASVASPTAASTQNVNVGAATFTGFTTAAAASQVFTITNSIVTTSSVLQVTVSNEGANDAQMTVTRVKRSAGAFEVTATNNGAAALNGNVTVSWWLLQA